MNIVQVGGREFPVSSFHASYTAIGVDPAREGSDYSQFTLNQGGELTGTFTEYGKRLMKRILEPKSCIAFDHPALMEPLRDMQPGAILSMGERRYIIYRRDWKRNKLWMKEIMG